MILSGVCELHDSYGVIQLAHLINSEAGPFLGPLGARGVAQIYLKPICSRDRSIHLLSYQRTKIQNKLVAGGFPKLISKFIATGLKVDAADALNTKLLSTEFTPAALHVYQPNEPPLLESGQTAGTGPGVQPPSPAMKAVADLLSEQKEALNGRVASLVGILGKQPTWGGAITKLEHKIDWKSWELGAEALMLEDGDDAPWIVCCRQFTWRYGPKVFPCPGIGSFITQMPSSDNSKVDLAFAVLPVEPFLKEGIALTDVCKFLDTETGNGYIAENCTIVRITHGDVLWVPYGNLAIPIASTDLEGTGTESEKKAKLGALATFAVMTPLVKTFAGELSKTTWDAISNWNYDHAKAQSAGPQSRLWTARNTHLKAFRVETLGSS